jgi:hypothetical protein
LTGAEQRNATDIDLWTRAFAAEQAKQAGISVRAWLDAFVAREAAGAAPPPADDDRGRTARPEPDDPMTGWSPAREAFGQRSHRPEALEGVEASLVSAAAILARAVDDAAPVGAGSAREPLRSGRLADELGVRARVSHAGQSARRRLDSDEIQRLLAAPAQPAGWPEADSQAALGEIEQALREIREQMDAAAQLTEAAAGAPPNAAVAPQSAPSGEASTEAIANLGLDIARLVEVMDCGFERIETASVRQSLELRSEVSQMFGELASRMERFERHAADPGAEISAETVAEPAAASSMDIDPREIDSGGAPGGDASDEARIDEAVGQALSWWPSALPALAAPDLPEPAPQASAVENPDAELFEDASRLAELVQPAPHPPGSFAWPGHVLAERTATELAQTAEAQAGDDPDADLFVGPPEMASQEPCDRIVGAAPADPLAWPAPTAAEPDAQDDARDEVWFGAGSPQTRYEPAQDEEAPDHAPTAVARFNRPVRGRADADPGAGGGKRVRFPWLNARRADRRRKTA